MYYKQFEHEKKIIKIIQEFPSLKYDIEAHNAIEVLLKKGFDVTLKPIIK